MYKNTFYFNIKLNLCATETWVVDYIYINDNKNNMSKEDIRIALHYNKEFPDWYECNVSDDIFDKMYN